MLEAGQLKEKSKHELCSLVQTLQLKVVEQTETIDTNRQTIANKEKTILELYEALRLSRHRFFAKKSEKDHNGFYQVSLFDEAVPPEDLKAIEAIEAADEAITVASHPRKKGGTPGRKPLPEELPRVERIYDLSDEEKQCDCGGALQKIGEMTSEQLDIIPAKIQVIRHIRLKYACPDACCDVTVKQARMPKLPIPKSIASASLLAHVWVSKYVDHLPLYRQEKILQRSGVDIPRSSMSAWVIRCSKLLEPLVERMRTEILGHDIAYADETRVQVLKEPDRAPSKQSYMWVFGGGPPERFSVVFRYAQTRAHDVPLTFLDGYKGYLHCDGYGGYDALATRNPRIVQVGCWYHCRRKFVEASQVSKKAGLARQVVRTIGKLSKIEREAADEELSSDACYALRQKKAR